MMRREAKPIWQVAMNFAIVFVFTVFCALSPSAMAGSAVFLSDEDLDSIFAEGFKVSVEMSVTQLKSQVKNLPTNLPKAPPKTTAATNPPNVTKPATPTAPVAPTVPSTSNLPQPSANTTSGAGVNAVLVNDRSQQFLSSLININSAGSIVPVLLNLMVNINSTIQNATNTNTLNLDNFVTAEVPAASVPVPQAPPDVTGQSNNATVVPNAVEPAVASNNNQPPVQQPTTAQAADPAKTILETLPGGNTVPDVLPQVTPALVPANEGAQPDPHSVVTPTPDPALTVNSLPSGNAQIEPQTTSPSDPAPIPNTLPGALTVADLLPQVTPTPVLANENTQPDPQPAVAPAPDPVPAMNSQPNGNVQPDPEPQVTPSPIPVNENVQPQPVVTPILPDPTPTNNVEPSAIVQPQTEPQVTPAPVLPSENLLPETQPVVKPVQDPVSFVNPQPIGSAGPEVNTSPSATPQVLELPPAVTNLTTLEPGAAPADPNNFSPEISVPETSPEVQVEAPQLNIQTFAPNGSGLNLVLIGDQAQQHLSALVNVNAAGSVVPILINFVININSNVNNLSNSNQLNIDDFYRFQVR